ncbi:MAG: endonuclease III [Bacteroidota bacterium]
MKLNKKERIAFIIAELDRLYPETPIPLEHSDPYTLLIAVLMSAQSTDVSVNKVTPALFKKAATAKQMAMLTEADILPIIKTVGLAPSKAKNIIALSKILEEKFNGEVPQSFEELESLPGVGHKTASVVMSQAFGVPAFPVDTHIHRLMQRWKLSNGKNVEQTEEDAKRLFPMAIWNKLHLQIIFFGREYCSARSHIVENCPICSKI